MKKKSNKKEEKHHNKLKYLLLFYLFILRNMIFKCFFIAEEILFFEIDSSLLSKT